MPNPLTLQLFDQSPHEKGVQIIKKVKEWLEQNVNF
jgi:hypothetical protein